MHFRMFTIRNLYRYERSYYANRDLPEALSIGYVSNGRNQGNAVTLFVTNTATSCRAVQREALLALLGLLLLTRH